MKAPVLLILVSLTSLHAESPVSFVRDVMPILNKAGCTQGTCHGAAKGKNGFKLSLRGYDPEYDYRSLIQDLSGRRFNRADPGRSLMLLKPTNQLPHGGGLRFEVDAPYYKTLFQWISEGAEFGDPVSAQVTKLDVEPPELLFPGGQRALEPDGDAGQAGRDRAQVDREKPGPAPYEPAAQGDEGQVGQVHGDDHVGQATSDHLLTVPCLPRLSIGRCAAGEASLR